MEVCWGFDKHDLTLGNSYCDTTQVPERRPANTRKQPNYSGIRVAEWCGAGHLPDLWDDGDPGPEGAQAELGDVQPIDGQRSGGCLIDPV